MYSSTADPLGPCSLYLYVSYILFVVMKISYREKVYECCCCCCVTKRVYPFWHELCSGFHDFGVILLRKESLRLRRWSVSAYFYIKMIKQDYPMNVMHLHFIIGSKEGKEQTTSWKLLCFVGKMTVLLIYFLFNFFYLKPLQSHVGKGHFY